MRIRIGVRDRPLANQIIYLRAAQAFWMHHIALGYVTESSTIVDIGSGCGRWAHHLRDYRYKNHLMFQGKYIGIDIDPDMLAWCRKNFDSERFDFIQSKHVNKSYHQNDGGQNSYCSLPIATSGADFVFSTSLFTHLLEPELKNYLEESFRVLKPGGHMVMSFFCIDRPPYTLGGRHTFKHTIGNAKVESLKVPEAAVAYQEDFMINLACSVGFSSAEVIGVKGEVFQCDLVCTK
jgi:SAM-dependent methyltransferase